MEKAKRVIEYYLLNNKLKSLIRSGWKNWHVSASRLESVAEHVYGTTALAIAMYSEYEYDLDFTRVLYMLCVHELEEIYIGDLTYWDISREDKLKRGHEAVSMVLNGLKSKEEIQELILEFDKRETKEAKFAYHIDKLEADIQAKIYDSEGLVDMNNQEGNPSFDKEVIELLKKEKGNFSNMWIEYDKKNHLDDNNFIEVMDYLKEKGIK